MTKAKISLIWNKTQNDLNTYGLKALGVQQDAGAIQRGIDAEGVAADYAEFKEQRDYPYKQLTYQQSLLQGLPVEAMSREFVEPSQLAEILGYGGTLAAIYDKLFGD